jgi:hypothetical protein
MDTCEQPAALIIGLEGIGNPDTKVVTEKPFRDVPLDHWAAEEIAAAKKAGIIAGYSDGTFNPESNVTIEQLAVVFVKVLNLEPVHGEEVEGASEWAAAYVQAAIDAGLIPVQNDYTTPASRETMVSFAHESEALIRHYPQLQSTDSPEETAAEEEADRERSGAQAILRRSPFLNKRASSACMTTTSETS